MMIPLFSSFSLFDRRFPKMAKIWTDIWQLTSSPACCLDGNVYDTVYFIKRGSHWCAIADGELIAKHSNLRALRNLFWFEREVI